MLMRQAACSSMCILSVGKVAYKLNGNNIPPVEGFVASCCPHNGMHILDVPIFQQRLGGLLDILLADVLITNHDVV